MRVKDIPGIDRLSAPEKIMLVEDLWDSISTDQDSVGIPESHIEELDERLRRLESSPGRLLSLEDLQRKIQEQR